MTKSVSGVFETQILSEFGSATQNTDNSDYRGVLTNSPNLSNDKLSIIAEFQSFLAEARFNRYCFMQSFA